MSLWDWIIAFFRTPVAPVPTAQGLYKPGDLVWFLYSPGQSDPLPSIEEAVILKQFSIVEAVPLAGGIPHSYRICAGDLKLTVHESYLSRTPVEAINDILVEYLPVPERRAP